MKDKVPSSDAGACAAQLNRQGSRMRNISLLAILMFLLGVGSGAVAAEPIARVSVLSTGKLLLDGEPTTLVALHSAFAALRASRGVVWYYREGAEAEEMPVVARQVLDLALNHSLPIRFSTKPDFSDEVGIDGRPIPREP